MSHMQGSMVSGSMYQGGMYQSQMYRQGADMGSVDARWAEPPSTAGYRSTMYQDRYMGPGDDWTPPREASHGRMRGGMRSDIMDRLEQLIEALRSMLLGGTDAMRMHPPVGAGKMDDACMTQCGGTMGAAGC